MKKKVKNTKKSIRLRVKNALKKREHVKAYRPTLPVTQSWFRTLNRGLFHGRLIEPDMFVKRLVGDWGRVVANWDNRKCRVGTYNQNVIPYEKAEIVYKLLKGKLERRNEGAKYKHTIIQSSPEIIDG